MSDHVKTYEAREDGFYADGEKVTMEEVIDATDSVKLYSPEGECIGFAMKPGAEEVQAYITETRGDLDG